MTEQEVISLIPQKIKKVLNYIEYVLNNKKAGNIIFNFSHTVINNQDMCILGISENNICKHFSISISSNYDYLFYQQLFVSVLDNYLKSSQVSLSLVYPRNEKFSYSFYLLSNKNINIQINSTHDLTKMVDYYNETVLNYSKKVNDEIGGAKK